MQSQLQPPIPAPGIPAAATDSSSDTDEPDQGPAPSIRGPYVCMPLSSCSLPVSFPFGCYAFFCRGVADGRSLPTDTPSLRPRRPLDDKSHSSRAWSPWVTLATSNSIRRTTGHLHHMTPLRRGCPSALSNSSMDDYANANANANGPAHTHTRSSLACTRSHGMRACVRGACQAETGPAVGPFARPCGTD